MLDRLPEEIIDQVFDHLGQQDALEMSVVSSRFLDPAERKLYRSITVDRLCGLDNNPDGSTVVRGLYALGALFRRLVENGRSAAGIRRLCFKSLPDMPEFELNRYLEQIFPKLLRLESMRWSVVDTYLSGDLFQLLPMLRLSTLAANFKDFDLITTLIPSELLHLKELAIAGFNNRKSLDKINLLCCPNIEKLIILKNCCGSSYCLPDLIEIDPMETGYLSKVLTNVHLKLTALVLKDITLTLADGCNLVNCVDLSRLQEFSIINCNEIYFDDHSLIRTTPPQVSFLDIIAPHLHNVSLLTIDLSNELHYYEKTLKFISTIPSLKSLDVYFRFKNNENLSYFFVRFMDVLSRHPLKSLSFNFEISNTNNKSKNSFSARALQGLCNLVLLESLKLPLEQHQIVDLFPIISRLPHLQFLHIYMPDLAVETPGNTLIHQDYFYFLCPCTCDLKESMLNQATNYCLDYKSCNKNLHFIIFENSNEASFSFSCKGKVRLLENTLSLNKALF